MIHEELQKGVAAAVAALYQHAISPADIPIQVTREEYEGDLTVVVFPFTKVARQKPPEVGAAIGEYLATHVAAVASFSCVQGFLNLTLTNDYWHSFTASVAQSPAFGKQPANGRKVLVEYSSPNTNKPLHLGHVRNILLGWSVANVLEWAGNDIVRTQVINDRGIHICKSMLMWKLHANGATP